MLVVSCWGDKARGDVYGRICGLPKQFLYQ